MSKKEEKKNSILREMPDEIKEASKAVQEKWLEWKQIDEENRGHPDRFYDILNPDGETVTLDLMGLRPVIEKICIKNGVKRHEINKIIEKQQWFHKRKIHKGNVLREMKKLLYGNTGKSSRKQNVLNLKKANILELFGQFFTTKEVHDIITKKWGYNASYNELKRFRAENEALITKKKADYILKKDEFRLGTDTGRLEELSDLYFTLKQKFEETERIEYSRELRSLIEQVRKEIKGDEVKLTVDGKIDVNASIQANKNVMEVARRLPIHMMVVGLVAAKQNLDPTQIMAQLANSYYSKLNGFNGVVELHKPQEIVHPSTIIKSYDWGEIKKIAKEEDNREEVRPLSEFIEYKDKEKQEKAFKRKESVKDLIKRFEESQKERHNERRKSGEYRLHPKYNKGNL